jgi:hypothetical protein
MLLDGLKKSSFLTDATKGGKELTEVNSVWLNA